MNPPEHQFLSRLQSNDPVAFRELVGQFKDRVYNTALGILQHAEDAEDTTQEVFISVYQSVKSFKGESKLSTWIYRITVTKSLEHIRKKNRKKRFAIIRSIVEPGIETRGIEIPHFHHPGVILENKERAAVLFKAIEQLPEKQKTAFILSKVEDLSYQEISEVMGTSISSVESLLFRAKQNLQKILSSYYKNNEK
jgi:RNA polymerase sigma factor (sigma-70 family)